MILKPRRKPGVADVSDLSKNEVVKWQHRWYLPLIITMGFLFPMAVAGLGWGDWKGGFYFAGAARLMFVHHVRLFSTHTLPLFESLTITCSQSTFCVNSLAHWLGETPFDDKHTPKDHFITALVTVGEGYHNFVRALGSPHRSRILTSSPQRSTTSSRPTSATPSSGTSTILPVRFLSPPRPSQRVN